MVNEKLEGRSPAVRMRLAENRALSGSVRLLRLTGDVSAVRAPGQFVMVSVPGKFLRRPFSVCDWDAEEGWLTLVVEHAGEGTGLLQALEPGAELEVLTGLGKGFALRTGRKAPVLVAGGSGLSPLVGLARRLAEAGCAPKVLLGFREERERFGAELFEGVAAEVRYAADVLGALEETEHDTVYACGSRAMMEELSRREPGEAQLAFDVRMGCGFGACMGCAIRTRDGMKRVCTDGPVFEKWEMINEKCSMGNVQ